MNNVDILCLASTVANCIEQIDLRENKWIITKSGKEFNNLFGLSKVRNPKKDRLLICTSI